MWVSLNQLKGLKKKTSLSEEEEILPGSFQPTSLPYGFQNCQPP